MPMFVAGYYVTFETVRRIMAGLQVDDRGAEDDRLEFPINNWLAEHSYLNVLAGANAHPTRGIPGKEDGELLMTCFIEADADDPIVNDVKEAEKRDIPVKNWLVTEGKVRPDDLEWVGLWDNFWLTRSGTIPRSNGHRQRKIRVATSEEIKRWYASTGMTLSQFIAHEERLRAEGKLQDS